MFSKISGFLKSGAGPEVRPSSRGPSAREYDREKQGRKNTHAPMPAANEDAEGDVTLLSVEAIRVMIIGEETLGSRRDEIAHKLTRLERAGFKSIPVSGGQSVFEAVEAALSFVSGS